MKIDKQQTAPRLRLAANVTGSLLGVCFLTLVSGCQSVGLGSLTGRDSSTTTLAAENLPDNAAASEQASEQASDPASSAGKGLIAQLPGTNRLVGFVSGKRENLSKAKQFYQRGDALFKEAARAPKATRTGMFSDAAKLFEKAADEAPGSGLNQDALFMQGESLFFANDLNGARDAFETLQHDFPRNRHSDRAAARLFSISKYWIDVSKAGSDAWYTLNLFDSTRPLRDADGHAVKVLDQIRYDDPTGKLADDATMAAAAEYIRKGEYERADEFLTDLRETFTDSDHLFLAHLLGIRCKLEIYAGPRYSERVLDEAGTLVEQTRRRFPVELQEKKYSDLLARAAAEIAYHKAEKLAFRARYRERQSEYGAARELYRKLLRDHPETPQATQAREVLAKIEDLPASPTRTLAFLADVFPSAKRSTPLVTVESDASTPEPPAETTGTKILR